MKCVLTVLLLSVGSVHAAEMRTHRDLAYAMTKNKRQTLDVYAPTEGKGHPVVFWIHGGGWRRGDKAAVQRKPRAFVNKGFVFVSVNSTSSNSRRLVRKESVAVRICGV